jgi:acyl carrier protein
MIGRDEFLGEVRHFIQEQTGSSGADVGWSVDLLADEVLDSLSHIEFLYFLLDLTGRDLGVDDIPADGIATVEDAFQFVRGRRT